MVCRVSYCKDKENERKAGEYRLLVGCKFDL